MTKTVALIQYFYLFIWPAFDETDGPGPCQAAAIPEAWDPGHPATLELWRSQNSGRGHSDWTWRVTVSRGDNWRSRSPARVP